MLTYKTLKTMRKILGFLIVNVLLTVMVSCSDWISTSAENIEDSALRDLYSKRDSLKWAAEDQRDKENKEAYAKYLENLRAYKESEHPIMFGWFAGWDPDRDSPVSKMTNAPDSMDVVSVWGGPFNLSEAKIEELRAVQEKGTKVVIGWIIENIGDQIIWGRENWPADDKAAIAAYAGAIVDSIYKYKYDGFDYDYEPSYASPWGGMHCGDLTSCNQNGGKENENLFMELMRHKLDSIGELLNKRMLFHLNGSIHWLTPTSAKYFDRFVVQSYNGSAGTFQNWENQVVNRLGNVQKQIVYTETFENKPQNKPVFANRYAEWVVSKNGNCGGIGVYHIQEDAQELPLYQNVRKAIQVMNPSIK